MDDLYDYVPEAGNMAHEEPQVAQDVDWLDEFDTRDTKNDKPRLVDYTVLRGKSKSEFTFGGNPRKIPIAELIFLFIATLFFHSDVFTSRVLNKIPSTVVGREITARGECIIGLLLCLSVLAFGILHGMDII